MCFPDCAALHPGGRQAAEPRSVKKTKPASWAGLDYSPWTEWMHSASNPNWMTPRDSCVGETLLGELLTVCRSDLW
jgi:hypothetical protein